MSQASEQIASQFANANVNKKAWGDILYNVKVYGGKGDGIADDRAAIESLAAQVSQSGGGTIFFPPGTYLFNGAGVTLSNISNVSFFSFHPDLVTFKGGYINQDVINLTNCSNIIIDGISLEMPTGAVASTAIELNTCNKVFVRNCKADSSCYDFINVQGGSTDVWVEGNLVDGCKNQGINVPYGSRVHIRGNTVRNIGSTSADLANLYHGIYVAKGSDITIMDNIIDGCYGYGIHCYNSTDTAVGLQNVSIAGNVLRNNGRAASGNRGGLYIGGNGTIAKVSISNLICTGNNGGDGAYIENVQGFSIVGLESEGHGGYGLVVTNGAGKKTRGNVQGVLIGNTREGIRLINNAAIADYILSLDVLVTGHTSAGVAGIYATGTDKLKVSGIVTGNTTNLSLSGAANNTAACVST